MRVPSVPFVTFHILPCPSILPLRLFAGCSISESIEPDGCGIRIVSISLSICQIVLVYYEICFVLNVVRLLWIAHGHFPSKFLSPFVHYSVYNPH